MTQTQVECIQEAYAQITTQSQQEVTVEQQLEELFMYYTAAGFDFADTEALVTYLVNSEN